MIKNIKFFVNDNKPNKIVKLIKDRFVKNGFIISDNKYDLAIAIGGDGTFLRMIHENKFNSNICYVGINLGTLGFSQDVNLGDVDRFISELKEEKYNAENISIEETIVSTDNRNYKIYSMNEIVIRNDNLKTLKLDINICGNLLEKYVGDALLISTPFGSTAENLSYNGSIVYNLLPSLQITPIGPINSSKYKTLRNSVIVPSCFNIELIFDNSNIFVISDGKKKKYKNVNKVISRVSDKKIKLIRFSDYSFESKINYKMLN